MPDHIEAAHPRHLQIQKYQVGFEPGNLAEGIVAVGGFTGDLDVRKTAQFLAQHLARDRFVVHNQSAYRSGIHLPGSNAKICGHAWITHG